MWVLWISECLSVRGHKSVPHRLKRKLEQKLLCLRMHGVSEHSSVLMRDCASRVSSLWECIMAKEHVCQWEDKLKQDVLAPRSFEGVPHHTSDSAEGRSTTIKGHSVYLNLPASACQMFQSFSFISSHEPYFSLIFFFFSRRVCCSTFFYTDEKQELCLAGGEERAKFEHCFICLRKLAEIEGFGGRGGRQGSLVSPSSLPVLMKTLIPQRPARLGPINVASIKSSSFGELIYTCQTFSLKVPVILTEVFPLDYSLADCWWPLIAI